MKSLSLVDILNKPAKQKTMQSRKYRFTLPTRQKNVKMQECAIVRNNVCLLQDSSMSSSFSLKKQLLTAQFFGR